MTQLIWADTAESVGISSAEVQRMIDDMEVNGIDIHSLMIIRFGKVAVEAYKSPLTKSDTHMMFSISKSFLSVAYGFAESEGKVNENTKFLDIFPEYAEKANKKLRALKLYDLIGMTAGKRTARGKSHWLNSFVNAKWDFMPGTDFRYVSDNYYAASAALTKIVGMSITEYLTPRLYEPLGIEAPFWETSPQGIEAGGWGMFLTTRDVAKFILCCHNNGEYNGKQVIPADWLNKATSRISDSSTSQHESDSAAGYGYGFWRCAGMTNTYRCEGLYSQYAISFDDYDACLIMTGGCAQLQKTLDVIWRHMKNAFVYSSEKKGQPVIIPPTKPFITKTRSPLESKIEGMLYKLGIKKFVTACGFPVGALTMPATFFAKEKGGNITDISFKFEKDGFIFNWTEQGGYKNSIYVAFDGNLKRGKIEVGELNYETVAYGRWVNDNTLEIIIKAIGNVIDRQFVFKFKGNKIVIYPDTYPSMDERAKVIGDKLKTVLKGKYFELWINFLVPKVKYILQPTHRGKAYK